MRTRPLTWVEVDTRALEHNARSFKMLVGEHCLFAPVVKANGYGHGLVLAAQAFEAGGADWLCVHELDEALRLREAGIQLPLYIVGYVDPSDAQLVVECGARLVVYSEAVVRALHEAALRSGTQVPVHIKLETGNHRQGLEEAEAWSLLECVQSLAGVSLEGLATHFADIEDTTDHGYAREQLSRFSAFESRCKEAGISVPIVHSANSAATLLWSHAHGSLVRVGIAGYGMWPSNETLITALQSQRESIDLKRALTWKARVAQVKSVPAGSFVGYGRTYRTTHETRLAVLTVGYYDGYDRKLSNQAFVLINGHRAPVRGRVCMNMVMVDVTHVPHVEEGTEVVLLGPSGDDAISPEMMGDWVGTIHYEITSRIHERIPRIAVSLG